MSQTMSSRPADNALVGVVAWLKEQRCSFVLHRFSDGRLRFVPRECRNPATENGRCWLHQDEAS